MINYWFIFLRQWWLISLTRILLLKRPCIFWARKCPNWMQFSQLKLAPEHWPEGMTSLRLGAFEREKRASSWELFNSEWQAVTSFCLLFSIFPGASVQLSGWGRTCSSSIPERCGWGRTCSSFWTRSCRRGFWRSVRHWEQSQHRSFGRKFRCPHLWGGLCLARWRVVKGSSQIPVRSQIRALRMGFTKDLAEALIGI